MINRIAALEEALRNAAKLFREYEALHAAKLGPDHTITERAEIEGKVVRNRLAAENCEAALALPVYHINLDGTALDPTT